MPTENEQNNNTTIENKDSTPVIPKPEVNPDLVKFEEERLKLDADRKSFEDERNAFLAERQKPTDSDDDFDFDEVLLDPFDFFGKKYKLDKEQVLELAQHSFWKAFPNEAPAEFKMKTLERMTKVAPRQLEKKLAREQALKQKESETATQKAAEEHAEKVRTQLYSNFRKEAEAASDESHPFTRAFFTNDDEEGTLNVDALTSAMLECAKELVESAGEEASKLTMGDVKDTIEKRLAARFGRVKPKQENKTAVETKKTETKTTDSPDTISNRDTAVSVSPPADRVARAIEAAKLMFKKE